MPGTLYKCENCNKVLLELMGINYWHRVTNESRKYPLYFCSNGCLIEYFDAKSIGEGVYTIIP